MQKFVVVKKNHQQQQQPSQHPQHQQQNTEISEILPAKVKMSGYLKKKRNKMGGWRKLWFVLQNQLLLSYNSREEYDKKLVSFKDVLNLVPGTIVRPLGGFRFTIQTTTDIIYTFRCDDSKTCTLWITALIESLTMQGKCAKENGVRKTSKFNLARSNNVNQENKSNQKEIVQASHSWDSVFKSKNVKFARIPIAQSTARILERNGLSTSDLNAVQQCKTKDSEESFSKRVWNFRLHEKRFSLVNQSDQVSRINRMFSRSVSNVNSAEAAAAAAASTVSADIKNPLALINRNNYCNSRSTTALCDKIRESKAYQHQNNLAHSTNCINSVEGDFEKAENCNENSKKSKKKNSMITTVGKDLNENNMMNEGNPECSALEKQIEQLNIKDFNLSDDQNENIYTNVRKGRNFSNENGGCEYHFDTNPDITFDASSSSQLQHQDEQQQQHQHEIKSHHNHHHHRPQHHRCSPRLSASSDNVNKASCAGAIAIATGTRTTNSSSPAEPIYAVVDLKNKYARRAQIRELEVQEMERERERPKSVHVVTSGDYEEVLNFSSFEFLDKEDGENENIYEPINIPDNVRHHHHQRHAMWKFFPRINIEALIELTRSSSSSGGSSNCSGSSSNNNNNSRKKTVIKTISSTSSSSGSTTDQQQQQQQQQQQPQFAFLDIRKKFGTHRKSIKNRIKQFYNNRKEPMIEIKERNAISDDELDSQGATGSTSGGTSNSSSVKSSCGNIEKPMASFVFNELEKYRRGEKQFFGSLSRLKKTRTSLCLDDQASKQKLLVLSKSACLQQQQQQQNLQKDQGSTKKVVCHSQFYH